jgi:trigger factor
MQVSVEHTGGLERRMTVQVPAERVDQEVSSRLESMSRTVRLDGFRPGKVPVRVIQQKYGDQVRQEVIEQVINSTLQEALTQENLSPAAMPSIEPQAMQQGEMLEYVATFEVFPEFTGALDYGFSIVRPVVEVADNDVNDMLEKLRKQRATWNQVERAAALHDQVVIDFEGTVDGEAFSGNKAQNMPLELGSGSMIPGFEDQLLGVSGGDEKTISVTFPGDYPSAEVAGKQASFAIKVHSVAEMALPELDDEFARAFGVSEGGIDALRQEVTGNMQRELKQLITANMKDQVFSRLLEKNPVEVPRSLIEQEVTALQGQAQNQGLDSSALESSAERRVKLGVLLSEIVKQNQIQVDPDRVRLNIETIAASYENPDEVVQYYYGNQEMLSGVQTAVIEEQAVDWILENSGVAVEDKASSFDELVEAAKRSKG